jgi:hypothetical protein
VDGDILFGLLKKVAPNVYKHLVSTSYIFMWLFVFNSSKTPYYTYSNHYKWNVQFKPYLMMYAYLNVSAFISLTEGVIIICL